MDRFLYMLRKPGKWPNGQVEYDKENGFSITRQFCEGAPLEYMEMSRADARLLARRIKQCLMETSNKEG
jgi:hypothetical protein